jgi:hypothetical protein
MYEAGEDEEVAQAANGSVPRWRSGGVDSGIYESQEYYAWQSLAVAPMTPELEVERRTNAGPAAALETGPPPANAAKTLRARHSG